MNVEAPRYIFALFKGVSCDNCQKNNFFGRRYKCLICSNYDLCSECYDGQASRPRIDAPKLSPVFYSETHDTNHPMLCILTPNDYDVCFGGEASRQAISYVCPYCGLIGLTERELINHVQTSGSDHENKRIICPLCAGSSNRNPNNIVNDLIAHYNAEHNICPGTSIPYTRPYRPLPAAIVSTISSNATNSDVRMLTTNHQTGFGPSLTQSDIRRCIMNNRTATSHTIANSSSHIPRISNLTSVARNTTANNVLQNTNALTFVQTTNVNTQSVLESQRNSSAQQSSNGQSSEISRLGQTDNLISFSQVLGTDITTALMDSFISHPLLLRENHNGTMQQGQNNTHNENPAAANSIFMQSFVDDILGGLIDDMTLVDGSERRDNPNNVNVNMPLNNRNIEGEGSSTNTTSVLSSLLQSSDALRSALRNLIILDDEENDPSTSSAYASHNQSGQPTTTNQSNALILPLAAGNDVSSESRFNSLLSAFGGSPPLTNTQFDHPPSDNRPKTSRKYTSSALSRANALKRRPPIVPHLIPPPLQWQSRPRNNQNIRQFFNTSANSSLRPSNPSNNSNITANSRDKSKLPANRKVGHFGKSSRSSDQLFAVNDNHNNGNTTTNNNNNNFQSRLIANQNQILLIPNDTSTQRINANNNANNSDDGMTANEIIFIDETNDDDNDDDDESESDTQSDNDEEISQDEQSNTTSADEYKVVHSNENDYDDGSNNRPPNSKIVLKKKMNNFNESSNIDNYETDDGTQGEDLDIQLDAESYSSDVETFANDEEPSSSTMYEKSQSKIHSAKHKSKNGKKSQFKWPILESPHLDNNGYNPTQTRSNMRQKLNENFNLILQKHKTMDVHDLEFNTSNIDFSTEMNTAQWDLNKNAFFTTRYFDDVLENNKISRDPSKSFPLKDMNKRRYRTKSLSTSNKNNTINHNTQLLLNVFLTSLTAPLDKLMPPKHQDPVLKSKSSIHLYDNQKILSTNIESKSANTLNARRQLPSIIRKSKSNTDTSKTLVSKPPIYSHTPKRSAALSNPNETDNKVAFTHENRKISGKPPFVTGSTTQSDTTKPCRVLSVKGRLIKPTKDLSLR